MPLGKVNSNRYAHWLVSCSKNLVLCVHHSAAGMATSSLTQEWTCHEAGLHHWILPPEESARKINNGKFGYENELTWVLYTNSSSVPTAAASEIPGGSCCWEELVEWISQRCWYILPAWPENPPCHQDQSPHCYALWFCLSWGEQHMWHQTDDRSGLMVHLLCRHWIKWSKPTKQDSLQTNLVLVHQIMKFSPSELQGSQAIDLQGSLDELNVADCVEPDAIHLRSPPLLWCCFSTSGWGHCSNRMNKGHIHKMPNWSRWWEEQYLTEKLN